jgi:Mrp family chromosome partitioning ATPase
MDRIRKALDLARLERGQKPAAVTYISAAVAARAPAADPQPPAARAADELALAAVARPPPDKAGDPPLTGFDATPGSESGTCPLPPKILDKPANESHVPPIAEFDAPANESHVPPIAGLDAPANESHVPPIAGLDAPANESHVPPIRGLDAPATESGGRTPAGVDTAPTHESTALPLARFDTAPAANGSTSGIAYTQTRVFTPDPAVLERNRIFNSDSTEPAAVAFRMLRTQVIQRMDAHGWRSIAIFSPSPNDGKTTTAVNLAISLAGDRLHTVLLVDLDFKNPSLAARFGLFPERGSDDALLGLAPVEDCLYHAEGFDRLVIMPARTMLANSSEILAGPRGRDMMRDLRARYPERILVVDLPTVLTADDALSFSPLVECGLLVAAEGRTRRNNLVRTVELLAKTPLVGTVLNRAANALSDY